MRMLASALRDERGDSLIEGLLAPQDALALYCAHALAVLPVCS